MDRLLKSKKNVLRPNRYKSPEMQAEAAIKSYEQKTNDMSKEIQNNLLAQNGSLPERINQRKQSGRSRTYSPKYYAQLNFKGIQKKIEAIIEQSVIDKLNMIKEVKKKYKSLIVNENALKIAHDINIEVENIEADIERKKKQAITDLLTNNS